MVLLRALVLDMDGVLVNSNPWHRHTWREFCAGYGLHLTAEQERWMYGRRNDEIVRAFFGERLDPSEVERRGRQKEALFRERIAPHLAEAAVSGVREFLELHGRVPAALASNAERANVDFVLAGLSLEGRFQAVVSGEEVARPKPHPEIYRRAAGLLGMEPAGCLVFEDSLAGVTSAREAGARVVGLSTSHEWLPGAERMFPDFRDAGLARFVSGFLGGVGA